MRPTRRCWICGFRAWWTRMKQLPELRDVASDQQNNGLGLLVNIDRDTAGRLGITPQNIDDALYDSFGQRQVSTIYTQTNQFHVILEVEPRYQQDTASLWQTCTCRSGRRRPIWHPPSPWRAPIPLSPARRRIRAGSARSRW